MAYIRCGMTGGSTPGNVEVITGTMTGAAGSTSEGQITITSQQNKVPKRAQFWNTTNLSTNMSRIDWNGDYENSRGPCIVLSGSSSGTPSVYSMNVGVVVSSRPAVSSVTSTSITLVCPEYGYAGTWKYCVEFE